MKFLKKNYLFAIIAFLILLLITGYFLNKESSLSKKNEISNFAVQLKIRNAQLAKIQKNLLEKKIDINDLINDEKILFKKVHENLKLIDFNGYNFSKAKLNKKVFNNYYLNKYTTNDIIFNGNIGSTGTAYLDFYDQDSKIFLATYDGIFASANITQINNFKKIKSNIKSLIKYDEFYLHDQYGIKDALVINDKVYISYISEEKKDCYGLRIIFARLNERMLEFKNFYKTSKCVHKDNYHGFWAAQGAGGRIEKFDDENIIFTTGGFRNRPLAQDSKSDFGKILKINLRNGKGSVISIGHRNPQGLYYSKNFNFIISTEHGPKGGDEINLNHNPISKIKNFGWPISSYGEHYAKHYSKEILEKAPLNKSHKKYGFEEPLKYFDPSIGISQIISINDNDDEFFIGAMGNEIKDQDLGIHYIKLDKSRKNINQHSYIPLNERVRDIVISEDKNTILLFLETTSSIAILEKKIIKN